VVGTEEQVTRFAESVPCWRAVRGSQSDARAVPSVPAQPSSCVFAILALLVFNDPSCNTDQGV